MRQNFNNRFARLRRSHTAQKCDVINVTATVYDGAYCTARFVQSNKGIILKHG